jgi:putative iron-regulated protein
MKHINTLLFASLLFIFSSCKKDNKEEIIDAGLTNKEIQDKILYDFSHIVALAAYEDLENKMNSFYTSCVNFEGTQSSETLETAREAWKEARSTWEKSEAFLFGPVATNNIDPSTDTWPVDFNALDSLLGTSNAFTQTYINSLGDELKGYHPSEYLLWGIDGQKPAESFTPREKEYLIALAADLQIKATTLRASWDPNVANNYLTHVVNAGQPSSLYSTQRSAMEEIINAMAGICDEVANGKIAEPFTLADPSLEESPFSQNSLVDFKNNIQGVKNVYFGTFQTDGYGLHDFMSKNNLSLHNKIATEIENALASFNGITVPFGQAIIQQPTQVQHVINQINILNETLEDDLLPFIQQTVAE